MKIKLFGVASEENMMAKLGLGTKGGLSELELEINQFIKDKKLADIKVITTSTNYQNNVHAMICAMVLYDDIASVEA
jgi:hypothetical protein